jgi:hypothetical protein
MGPPRTWQGWLVLVAFFALLAVGALVFLPKQQLVPLSSTRPFWSWCSSRFATSRASRRWRWGKKSNN